MKLCLRDRLDPVLPPTMSRDDFIIGSTMFLDIKASLHIQILARTTLHDPFSSVQLQIFLSLLGYPCATASLHLWFSTFSFAYQRRFILSHLCLLSMTARTHRSSGSGIPSPWRMGRMVRVYVPLAAVTSSSPESRCWWRRSRILAGKAWHCLGSRQGCGRVDGGQMVLSI
jgi:hypothetical protein